MYDNIIESDLSVNIPIKRKYLIHVKWNTCLQRLSSIFSKKSIKHLILKGMDNKKNMNIINKFKLDDYDILLVSSSDLLIGLNLEFVTHLVFYNKIRKKNLNSQIIGRVQRLNRNNSLKLIILDYRY